MHNQAKLFHKLPYCLAHVENEKKRLLKSCGLYHRGRHNGKTGDGRTFHPLGGDAVQCCVQTGL